MLLLHVKVLHNVREKKHLCARKHLQIHLKETEKDWDFSRVGIENSNAKVLQENKR